jgi:hypothetical protein
MPTPNSVPSNQTSLAFAEETSLKTLPGGPVWYALEPNSYSDMGAQVALVARVPIVNHRQRARGTLTDLDAKVGFNADLTQRNLTRLLQGFFFQDALEKPSTNGFNTAQVAITGVNATQYTAAAGLDVFKVNHLVMAKLMTVANNNGLKKVTAVAAGLLTVGGLTADATAQAGTIEAVGYEFPAGDLVLTLVGGNTVVLTSATIDPTTLALNVGEWIFVGGDAAGNQYANNAGGFYGRILSVNAAAKTIVLDLTSTAVIADAGAAKSIRIFFGKTLQNAINPTNIKRRSYQLERQLGNDGSGVQSELVVGSVPNELTLNAQNAQKLTVDLSFVGMDQETRSGATGVKAGTRVASPFEDAYNTSHDIAVSKLYLLDATTFNPTALFAFATDLKIMLKNNVSGNKALAVLGAFDANVGQFEVSAQLTLYFSTIASIAAVRNNSDAGLFSIFAKKNAGFVIDVPYMGLGDGLNKVEKDKPITASLTSDAAKNTAGYTISGTWFEYLPTVAIPA